MSRNRILGMIRRSTFSSAMPVDLRVEGGQGFVAAGEGTDHGIRPYHEIPGPKQLPLLGNSWRFAPIIGKLKHNTDWYTYN